MLYAIKTFCCWCRFLYYTDSGDDAKVVRSYLDGSHPTVLIRGLLNPNGVTITDNGIVLIVDSRVKDKNATSAIYLSSNGGVLWTEVDNILLQVCDVVFQII